MCLSARKFSVVSLLILAPAWTPAAEPGRLSPDQTQALQSSLRAFRQHRDNSDRRAEVATEILKLGPIGARQLLKAIEKEMGGRLRRYGDQFVQAAIRIARGQTAQSNPAEVQSLRERVLALRGREDLTKEMIVATADPAMKQLRNILVVDREAVLESDKRLQSTRDELLQLGGIWEQCIGGLTADLPQQADHPQQPPSFETYLQGSERLAAEMAMPMSPQTRAALAQNAALTQRLDAEEARAILACNLTRNLLGLAVLQVDLRLSAAARDHSADMERLKFFDHVSPVAGKSAFTDRARNFGTTASGENIFAGVADGALALEAWFHSPGHHRNMLGAHRRIGLGRSGVYFTQLFGR